jgi:hypothetical protein
MSSADTTAVRTNPTANTKAGRGVGFLLDVLTALLITFAASYLLVQVSLRFGASQGVNESVYDPTVLFSVQ